MKRVTSPGSMHDAGCLGLVYWDNPEGWYGEGEGRGSGWGTRVYLWWIHVDVWQNQYNIVKLLVQFSSVQFSRSVVTDSLRPHELPGLPVHHQLLEFTQTHVHRVSDAIQPSHPLLSPSSPAPNPSQHQSLFQ